MNRTVQDILDLLSDLTSEDIVNHDHGTTTKLTVAIGKVHLLDSERRDLEEKLSYAQLDLAAARKEADEVKAKAQEKLKTAGKIIGALRSAIIGIRHRLSSGLPGAVKECDEIATAVLDNTKDPG